MFLVDDYVKLFGGGFIGVVLDEVCNWVFVIMCFDNGILIVSIGGCMSESVYVIMNNLEFVVVKNGWCFFYDVIYIFSCGDLLCVGCYIFGNMDYLVWDLGNLDEDVVEVVNIYNCNMLFFLGNDEFYFMKGFMII